MSKDAKHTGLAGEVSMEQMSAFFKAVESFIQSNHLERELEKAYYTRVQFEVRRSFYLEFNNKDNKDPHAQQRYKAFISTEPCRTAINRSYMPKSGFKQNIVNVLIEHGCFRLYNMILLFHKIKTRRRYAKDRAYNVS